MMSNTKVKDEAISTVRSIVGQDYTEMDILRALHMANNDATGAINIIFDTPNLISKPPIRQNPRISNFSRKIEAPSTELICIEESDNSDSITKHEVLTGNGDQRREKEDSVTVSGSEWWFVGYGEISGMSTCKGRRIKTGDEVEFAFPKNNKLSSPSPGRVFGRGKQVGVCSEIVRFSTKAGGEVGRIPNEWARCFAFG